MLCHIVLAGHLFLNAMFTIPQLLLLFGFGTFLIVIFCLTFFRKPHRRKITDDIFFTAEIKYSPKENKYILRGKRLLPVSVAVSLFFERFDQNRWAEEKSKQTGKPQDLIIEEWNLKGEMARRTGVFLHEEIAHYFIGLPMKGRFQFKFKSEHLTVDKDISIEKEESLFLKFVADENLRIYRTNYLVADRGLRIAGRVAFVGVCEDGYEIYDWKRAKGITDLDGNPITKNAFGVKGKNGMETIDDTPFWHYALQLNLYRAILEKTNHIVIRRIFLIDLCPTKETYVKISVPLINEEMAKVLKFLSA